MNRSTGRQDSYDDFLLLFQKYQSEKKVPQNRKLISEKKSVTICPISIKTHHLTSIHQLGVEIIKKKLEWADGRRFQY